MLHRLQGCLLFWIVAFQLSYSFPGLIYRCIAVERAGNIFPVFFLVLSGQIFEFCSFFSLGEVLLAISFPEFVLESFSFVSYIL